MECNHNWVDVGFTHSKMVCRYCDLSQEEYKLTEAEKLRKEIEKWANQPIWQGVLPQPSNSNQSQSSNTGGNTPWTGTIKILPFQIGDTVRCIDNSGLGRHQLIINKEYQISDIWGHNLLFNNDIYFFWKAERFELVKKQSA